MSESDSHDEAEETEGGRGGTGRRTFLQGSAATIGAGALASRARGQGADASTYTSSTGDSEEREPARATGSNGMVSSVHPQASQIGADVLRNGGNAIDAAVAVQFALNVVQPHSSGIGGGGFMVVYVAEEDELYTVDNRERAPLGAEKGMFLGEDGEPIPFEKRRTLGEAVGVPGTLRACDVALKRFGSRELSELIGPAIDLASSCAPEVTVDASLAEAIAENEDVFNRPARERFAPGGQPLTEGDTLVQPELAETFRTIRDEGIGAFYKGEIGAAVAEIVQENGGSMLPLDLARYNVTIDHPEYNVKYGDLAVRTQSLPSSGGLTIGQILRLLEPFDLGQYGFGSAESYEAMIEAFGLAYADRGEYMGDKAFVDAPWQGLFDESYLEKRRRQIRMNGAASGQPEPGDPWAYQPGEPYAVDAVGLGDLRGGGNGEAAGRGSRRTPFAADRGQTTHFTTADAEGNMVSWTSTIEQFFGTGIMVPDYGFMLNNELTDFDAVPGGPNEVMPGKRPLSSTSPTIVFRDGEPYMTVGSPGGKTIITTVAQILLNVAEFGMSVEEAIAAPRIYSDADPEVIWERAIDPSVLEQLRAYGFELTDEPMQLGNAQAIYVDRENDRYVGVADWRREGSVIGL